MFSFRMRKGLQTGYYMYQNCPMKSQSLKLNSWWYTRNVSHFDPFLNWNSFNYTPSSVCVIINVNQLRDQKNIHFNLTNYDIYSHVQAKRLWLKSDPLNSVSAERKKEKQNVWFIFNVSYLSNNNNSNSIMGNTHQIDKLWQPKPELHQHRLCIITDRSN